MAKFVTLKRIERTIRLGGLALGLFGVLLLMRQASNASAVTLEQRSYLPLLFQTYDSKLPEPSPFGVSDSSVLALAYTPQGLNLARNIGIYWNRTSVSWAAIEPKNTLPAQFDWRSADTALLPLLEQGVQPFTLILNNPGWAATTNCGPVHDPNDLAEFMGALGARYPEVKYWALYNEVDLATFSQSGASNGGCFGEADLNHNDIPDYADYAEMMRASWKALHTANPGAKLVFGLLAYDNFIPTDSPPNYPGGCCFSYHFLDNLLAYMRDHPLPDNDHYADVLGFNDYRLYNDYYWELYYQGDGLAAKTDAIRAKLEEYGFSFPLMTSELSSFATEPSHFGISQHEQARDLARLITQGISAQLEQVIWWPFADYPKPCLDAIAPAPKLPPAQFELRQIAERNAGTQVISSADECVWWTMGIVDENLEPKLAYFAYRTVIEQLQGWSPERYKSKKGVSIFFFKRGAREKRVYYSKTTETKVKIKAARVRIVDMFGKITERRAGVSGVVKVQVGADPIFVELNP